MWIHRFYSAGRDGNNPEILIFNGYVEALIAFGFAMLGLQAARAAHAGVDQAVVWTYPLGLVSLFFGLQATHAHITHAMEARDNYWVPASFDWPFIVLQVLFMTAGLAAIIINLVDHKGAYREDPYDSLVPSE